MSAPRVIATASEMRAAVLAARQSGQRVGLVPTMGALHAGHVSLVEASRRECQFTAVTIFVNPTQFGPHEDLSRYPRTLEADLARLAAAGADAVFTPAVEEVYPPLSTTMVEVGGVDRPLEGECRPGHFRGVATVVLKLFNMAPADVAYFGQKDYQQTLVVRRMVADLALPIEIKVCPIIREPDGLAMSSRNVYLSPDERRRALALSQSLRQAEQLVAAGERDTAKILAEMRATLEASVDRIEYVAIADAETLVPLEMISESGNAVALVAARVGATRLIDNAILNAIKA